MVHLGNLYFSATYINTFLLVLIFLFIIFVFIYFNRRSKQDRKKIEEIEKTYEYLKFLDEANQTLYEKYLKEKTNKSTGQTK